MRKRHKKKSGEDQSRPNSRNEANGSTENEKLGEDDPRSPTWSGHKSELPAEDPRSPTRSAHKSELPADDREMRSPVPAYEPYRGSYRSSRKAEAEGSPRFEGEGKADRGVIYEMPWDALKWALESQEHGDDSYRKLQNAPRAIFSVLLASYCRYP
jgi:hypothetical protein